MHILFTRNSSIASRLIRRLTSEDVSHCAVEYNGFVYHSNFMGMHVETVHHFYSRNEIVYSLQIHQDPSMLGIAVDSYEGSMYDYGAFLYIGLKCLLPFLPKINLWQTTGMFLCTEWVQEVLGLEIDSMITPYKLYELLSQKEE